MKKIKSVRLKREYRDTKYILFANQYATKIPDCGGGAFWEFKTSKGSQCSFSEQIIRINYTDLFEIEYEQERKYIDVRVECDPIYSFPDLDTIENYFRCDCGINNRLKVTKLAEGTL